jgi:chromate transporter
LGAAMIGIIFKKENINITQITTKKPKKVYLALFFVLLFFVPIFSHLSQEIWLFGAFYEAGSLVFGGGHVVLPLLQQTVGDSLSHDTFLVGYGAAQAVPGPMFALASYLGASILNESPFLGATIAVIAIFLPGFLLILAFKDSWESFAKQPKISAAVYGINASVVGLLVAAFVHPISTAAIHGFTDVALAIGGFILLRVVKIPVYWLIVLFCMVGIIT